MLFQIFWMPWGFDDEGEDDCRAECALLGEGEDAVEFTDGNRVGSGDLSSK